MASSLMSPPHNGTPFIYFTERLSLVISTALKSYYLYVNDEWIDCGCQEQYLFVSSGQPWLCFNSISPPSLNVIDNWCGRTWLSEGAKFFSSNRRVPCHFGVFTRGVLCCLQQQQFCCHRWWLDTDVILGRAVAPGKKPSEIMKLLRWLKMLHKCPQVPFWLCCSMLPFVPLSLCEIMLCMVPFFLCICLFLTQEQILSVYWGLTTLGKLKFFCLKRRAVLTGFRGLFCITQPEETLKQAPSFFMFFFLS